MRVFIEYLRELFAKEADCYLCVRGYADKEMTLKCRTCRGTGKIRRTWLG